MTEYICVDQEHDAWKCAKCGYEPKEGTTPKFCAECGNAF